MVRLVMLLKTENIIISLDVPNRLEKTYFLSCHFTVNWVHTRSICKAYDMDVLSLDSAEEADAFLSLCYSMSSIFGWQTHIGGMTTEAKSLTNWYWVVTNKKINFPMNWAPGEPNDLKSEKCLGVVKEHSDGKFYFNDLPCADGTKYKFVCQKVTYADCHVGSPCFSNLANVLGI